MIDNLCTCSLYTRIYILSCSTGLQVSRSADFCSSTVSYCLKSFPIVNGDAFASDFDQTTALKIVEHLGGSFTIGADHLGKIRVCARPVCRHPAAGTDAVHDVFAVRREVRMIEVQYFLFLQVSDMPDTRSR